MSALRTLSLAFLIACGLAEGSSGEKACSPAEKWEFSGELESRVPREFLDRFRDSFRASGAPFQGYADALALGQKAPVLSDYGMARALWKARLFTAAAAKFNALVERPPTKTNLPFALAAMACLEKMGETQRVSPFSDEALTNLPLFFKSGFAPESALPVLREALVHRLLRQLKTLPNKNIEATLKLFAGAAPYADFAKALVAVANGQPASAEKSFVSLIAAPDLPPSLKAHQDDFRLILARVLYGQEKFAESAELLHTIEPKSRAFVAALELQAWSALAQEKLPEAVTNSLKLFAGPFADDFAPEASGVAAIAFKEACQYPYAQRTNDTFKQNYPNTHRWLRESTAPLYPLAAAHQRGEKILVPNRIVREWVHSESFLRYQTAITQNFEEVTRLPTATAEAEEAVATVSAQIAMNIETHEEADLDAASDLLQPANLARSLASVPAQVVELRNTALLYERLTAALPVWKAEVEASEEKSFARREELVGRAENSLRALKNRMLSQIEEAAKNADFIEAEILSETSYEILRHGALPEPLSPLKLEQLKNELGRTRVSLANLCAKKYKSP